MSQRPIARNADLARLVDEGYVLEVDLEGVLLIKHVPYVTPASKVKEGTILFRLTTAGSIDDIVGFPDHTAFFVGETPCDHEGHPLTKIIVGSQRTQLPPGLVYDHYFSSTPGPAGYPSMYAQVRQYVTILESFAQRLEPSATAKVGPRVIAAGEPEAMNGPFVYADTASVRAGIVMASAKFRQLRIAVVGVGGTGSYVLDQVAKTPVAEIHLYDDDVFFTHNAFRGPGAATLAELRELPSKVAYWQGRYSAMHRGILAHAYRVTAANASELDSCDFVFLCMDSGPDKLAIVTALEERGISFIDCGIGVEEVDGALRGTVRVTSSTPTKRDHVRRRISFAPPGDNNDYERNIQVADLNALNAVLAVTKWKKLCGFYHDFAHEHESAYTINSHSLTRDEEQAPA
jgi:hypothetical protein